MNKALPFRVLWKPIGSMCWRENTKFGTKREAEQYLEEINPTVRPAIIAFGQRTIKAYDSGIIDYELIGRIESENLELRDQVRKLEIELQRIH